jgi:hypothetical protein
LFVQLASFGSEEACEAKERGSMFHVPRLLRM